MKIKGGSEVFKGTALSERFRKANMDELQEWMELQVYECCLHERKHVVSTRWVLTEKPHEDVTPRAQARLLAVGFKIWELRTCWQSRGLRLKFVGDGPVDV